MYNYLEAYIYNNKNDEIWRGEITFTPSVGHYISFFGACEYEHVQGKITKVEWNINKDGDTYMDIYIDETNK